jgi:hypothetical protein
VACMRIEACVLCSTTTAWSLLRALRATDTTIQVCACIACVRLRFTFNVLAWSYWHLKDDVINALNVCGDAGKQEAQS